MNDNPIFLEARNVSVEYPFNNSKGSVRTPVGGTIVKQAGRNCLVALNGISFRLQAGESLALMGHNGSGKTTLLRVLAGIYMPIKGEVRSHGVIGNALNTSIGFRAEATGRRNIALRALIAGYKRSELDQIIENVEEFAELGAFLDQPIYTYSAGMRARLTFGVATAFHSDILVLDEWLGAGDKRMQERTAQRMNDFVSHASITVLASHSTGLLQKTCTKGLVMDHGNCAFFGSIDESIAFYEETLKARQ